MNLLSGISKWRRQWSRDTGKMWERESERDEYNELHSNVSTVLKQMDNTEASVQ